MARILLCSSYVGVHDSQAYKQTDVTYKEVIQSYFGTDRNAPVVPNWFQPCQCRCHLCYAAEYPRLGTLTRYNGAQVVEACECLKFMSIYFDLLVVATGVVISLVSSALISMP